MEPPTSKEPDTVDESETEQKAPTTNMEKSKGLEVVLKSISALGTAVAVTLVGVFGSMYLGRRQAADAGFLAERQATETNLRLYTELMSKREEADTSLRKEMFNSIITNFLRPGSEEQPDKEVLNLELLAYNFHDSLDLAPLFKDVYKKLDKEPVRNQIYIERLKKVTRDVVAKQIAMLEEVGARNDGGIFFEDLKTKPNGAVVMDKSISVKLTDAKGLPVSTIEKQVRIEVLSVVPEKQELEIRLIVRNSQNIDEADVQFTVGYFDFPMLDNVRLAQGFRCAIVLNEFDEEAAEFTFIYFPGSRASLKEKPYYDEILYNLRRGVER